MASSPLLTVPPAPPLPERLHMEKMCGVIWTYAEPLESRRTFAPFAYLKNLRWISWDRFLLWHYKTYSTRFIRTVVKWYWHTDF